MDSSNELMIGKKVQAFRIARGMTLRELADKAGITPSMLSQIERDLANPSISTLKSISKVLSIPIFLFFKNENEDLVVRADQRKSIGIADGTDLKYELLTSNTNGSIEFCLMRIPPQNASGDNFQNHNGEEVAYILKGEVDIIISGTTYNLTQGDSIRIPPQSEHIWKNHTNNEVQVIFAITPPSY